MYSYYVLLSLSLFIITTNGLKSRVYGGDELSPYNHKYLVKLETYFKNNKLQIPKNIPVECSGSIVDTNWILTAAHCIVKGTKFIKILHLNPADKSMEVIATVKASGITSYPGYIHDDLTPRNLEKDLALIKTSRSIKFNEYVQPIKLAKITPRHEQSAIIAGFGMREPNLPAPREGMISVLLSKSCPDIRRTKLLCSYGEVRVGSGDSGGPVVSRNRLLGVISASCTDADTNRNCVSIFVDVVQSLKWIEKNMLK